MNFVVARRALVSTHYLEMKKIHDYQYMTDGSPVVAVE